MAIDKIKARLGRNSQALTTQQTDTAQVGFVRREWVEHPTSGLTPARLAEIMRDAEIGRLTDQLDLADDIEEKDAHVMAELAKRKNALLGKSWLIKTPPNASDAEQRDADMVNEVLNSLPEFEDLVLDMGDAILRGMNNSQITWDRDGQLYYPAKLETIPARRFTVDEDNPNTVLLRLDGGLSAPLWKWGWVQHSHKAKSGYIARAGLIRVLAWPFLFKNYSVRDLAEFLEIYGLPLRLGKYPTGASDTEKSTLLRAIMSIGHNAGGIIPKGMDIEFQEAAKGASDPYMAMMDWAERSQSKAILGGTLTSQADGKSSTNALGNVHNEVREELVAADLRQIASTLTRDLVLPLLELNGKGDYHNPRRRLRLEFDTQQPEDMAAFATALPPLVQMGTKIPANWVNDKLKIPVPKDGEAVLGMVQTGLPGQEAAPAGQADSVQQTALNGAQITSLSEIIQQVQSGTLDTQRAKALIKAGFPAIDDAAINNLLGLNPAALNFAALKAQPKPQDQLAGLTATLANSAGQQLDDDVAAIAALVDKAESWDDVERALIEAYKDQGAAALAGIMQQAMAAAQLAGRYDVELGN
ncbi:DUF935 domain-containing protein [Gallaecimonas xiamenensis]|uniref:Mu-like phage gp29 n=1 Tax=Gallaecimonas xiamenensis 3-C-1 TaxID=745411 RepID=K2IXP8_9GAMM|nr:DUF935 domain-containing protein [Gallaecimonas xiamenensis]EKE75196.1 Mu-like phage gp29 [Gallaecimonas xiamenensis 3-C-1]